MCWTISSFSLGFRFLIGLQFLTLAQYTPIFINANVWIRQESTLSHKPSGRVCRARVAGSYKYGNVCIVCVWLSFMIAPLCSSF